MLSANQCVKRKNLPDWITGKKGSTAVSDSQAANGTSTSRAGRRRSTLTVEEGHQLVLPSPGDANQGEKGLASLKSSSGSAIEDSSPDSSDEEFVSRGGSCIIGPLGDVLKEPLWEVEDGGLLIIDADFEDCERGRLDLDVAGSYSRNDVFHLEVDGLDLDPPP